MPRRSEISGNAVRKGERFLESVPCVQMRMGINISPDSGPLTRRERKMKTKESVSKVVLEVDTRGRKREAVQGSPWSVIPGRNDSLTDTELEVVRAITERVTGLKVYVARETAE